MFYIFIRIKMRMNVHISTCRCKRLVVQTKKWVEFLLHNVDNLAQLSKGEDVEGLDSIGQAV